MSKRSAKTGPLLITRRQQIEALRQQKSLEIADRVAGNIREAVKQEVEAQLKKIKEVMDDLIDAVHALEKDVYMNEGDSSDRQEGEETPPVSGSDEVVPRPGVYGEDSCSCDGHPDDACR